MHSMQSKLPVIVFLVSPEVETFIRLMARATSATMSDVIRLAIAHHMPLDRKAVGLLPQEGRRTARMSLYVDPELKALIRQRAAADGTTAGSWLAGACGDYASTWVRENGEAVVKELQQRDAA